MSHDQLPSCYSIFLCHQFFSLAVNEPTVNKPRSMILYVFLGFASALLLLSFATFFIWCYRRKRRKEVNGFVQFYVLTTDVKKILQIQLPCSHFGVKLILKLFSFPHFFFQITSSTARDQRSGQVGNSSWTNRIRGGAGPRCVWCSLQSNSEEKSWDRGVWRRDFKAEIVIEQQGSSSGCCKGFTR